MRCLQQMESIERMYGLQTDPNQQVSMAQKCRKLCRIMVQNSNIWYSGEEKMES